MTEGQRACGVCEKPFTPKRKWAAFCSAACRYAAWAKLHPRATIAEPVRGQVGLEPIAAPDAANAVSELADLKARLAVVEHELVTRTPTPRLFVLKPSAPATWRHGANCYRNHGCRCAVCVEGMRARKRGPKLDARGES